MKLIIFSLLICLSTNISAQSTTKIEFLEDEYWWGGVVAFGSQMPYIQPVSTIDLEKQNFNNQTVPLFLSNKGRYVWSEHPFKFTVKENSIILNSSYDNNIKIKKGGTTLKEAYLKASKNHFPPSGELPDLLFFTMPQYNTWIELMYNQNQEDIIAYAKGIIDSGLPPGVLMIDDNWQKHYGNFEFKSDKFPDPKGMINKLHEMGFKVMLWVCPFVSPDSPEFRELDAKNYLIKDKDGNSAIIQWWNGFSACYDFTNPKATKHFTAELQYLKDEYGVDGFKLDGGDTRFYDMSQLSSYKEDALSVDHTKAWAKLGLKFSFNEYRASWKLGGEALVQRLGDKDYSWHAVQILIPEMIAAGLLGYAYTCPDMIGGGQYQTFLNVDQDSFDQELIVRSTQVHALMPMMQFSVAPWRILNEENLSIVREMALLHQKKGDYIIKKAKESAQTGEPIVRHMEYSFPGEGFETCKDQFMLGERYLVAPVVTPENRREVKLPKGEWRDDKGETHKGGQTISINVPLNRLPYFKKLK
ncbi:glycoside hydrolase family 31 protein [Marinilabiliaceae bacterium ANBcel2]|nr:glycoside hydrolase family 31 protein [Marinilabiliaceae bacterium ANBcel2]